MAPLLFTDVYGRRVAEKWPCLEKKHPKLKDLVLRCDLEGVCG